MFDYIDKFECEVWETDVLDISVCKTYIIRYDNRIIVKEEMSVFGSDPFVFKKETKIKIDDDNHYYLEKMILDSLNKKDTYYVPNFYLRLNIIYRDGQKIVLDNKYNVLPVLERIDKLIKKIANSGINKKIVKIPYEDIEKKN